MKNEPHLSLEPQSHDLEKVRHLSFSALRTYVSDRQSFYQNYILREPRLSLPIGMLEGSAAHLGMERYLKGLPPMTARELLECSMDANQEVDWGKTGSLEKSIATVERLMDRFHEMRAAEDERLPWCGALAEEGWKVDLGGVQVKGFADAVLSTDIHDEIIDFKCVKSINSTPSLAYYLQAATYVLLANAAGHNVVRATFIEISKAKSPKIPYKLHEFTEFPEEDLIALKEYYYLTIDEILGHRNHYLPNVFSNFDNQNREAWTRFKQRLHLI